MKTAFKAAVVQAAPIAFDPEATVAKAEKLIAEASATGAKIVVFPEAFISAYPKGLNFSLAVGMRAPDHREAYRRYFDSAIDVPGPMTERLAQAARENRIYVVMGVIERAIGTLYCTVLFFSPDGELMGKHRKVMPTATERLVWGFGDGSTMPVFDTPVGKVGAVICWENYMPMMRMAMYSKGISLYCAPTADDRDSWQSTMHHIALEGRCFVLSACQFARRSDYPADYDAIQGNDPKAVLMRGGSVIIGPLGNVLAGPNHEGECILTAEVDLADVARGKFDLDVVGHYARPDIFRLTVDEQPKPAVFSNSGAITDDR